MPDSEIKHWSNGFTKRSDLVFDSFRQFTHTLNHLQPFLKLQKKTKRALDEVDLYLQYSVKTNLANVF